MSIYKRIENESSLLAKRIFENIELHKGNEDHFIGYTYPMDIPLSFNKKLLENPEKFETVLFKGFEKIFKGTKDEIVRGHFTCIKLFSAGNTKIFEDLFLKSNMDIFKHIINAYEKFLNSKENIIGDTNYYRSFILHLLSKNSSKVMNNMERIKYICESKILNSNNNECDKKTNEWKDSFDFEAGDFYTYYIQRAFKILESLKDNNYHDKVYPDGKMCRIHPIMVANQVETQNLKNMDFLKLNKEFVLNKFGFIFLKDLEKEYEKCLLKDSIHFLLKDDLTINDKKEMLIDSLMRLNLKNFKYICKKYPEILKEIKIDDVHQYDMNKSSFYLTVKENASFSKLSEKYGIKNPSRKYGIMLENTIKILTVEKSLFEKKEIKKSMKKQEKPFIEIKKRM